MKLATAAQMREMDRRAIEEFGIPSIVLMENAAIRVADEIAKRVNKPDFAFVVAAGSGNNGADGIAVARHLRIRYGAHGVIFLCGESESKTTPDFDINLKIAKKLGISVMSFHDKTFKDDLSMSSVVVDAILGTGAKGALRPTAAAAAKAIRYVGLFDFPLLKVSIDIPSGVDADDGTVYDPAVHADLTVTLGMSKPGLHLCPKANVGELVVADIAIPKEAKPSKEDLKTNLTDRHDVWLQIPSRQESRDTNKSTYGAVALFCGSAGFAGAATLSCLGATRAGAGLVTLGVPEGMLDVMMARLPDTVMTRGFAQTETRAFGHGAIEAALQFVEKMDAVGIGPGIGQDNETRKFVAEFVAKCPKPMVLDADALNCLSLEPDHGASIIKSRSAATILTPHPGEMGRLLGISSKDVQADRLGSVRKAAETLGCVALLKGDKTLIAAPDGHLAINETGNCGMSSGGMGDVLTGVATTFLAQIGDPFKAAASASYVHGMAGDLAATLIGKAGLMANEVADFVATAIKQIMDEEK